MTSNRTKPQLVQKGIERRKPKKQRKKAINILGIFDPAGVSQMTVDVASTMEKAESIPSKKRVAPSIIAQRFLAGIMSQAVGYAMKARPMLDVFDLAKLSFASRKPTTVHTAKPETKLTVEFDMQMIMLSIIIGFLVWL